jgi:hypothetical protein
MAKSLENKLALLEARLEEAINRGASDADLTRIRRRIDSINESIRDSSKLISEQLKDFDELDGSLSSIGNLIGKNTNLYEKFDEQILAAKASLTSVSNLIETSTQLTLKQKEKAAETANVYAKFIPSISEMVSKIKLGTGTQEQINESVISTYKNYKLLASQIDRSTRDGAAMGAQLDAMADNMQSFYEASMKSAKQLQNMDGIMGQFSGIPAMSEFNTLLKTNKNDTLALRAALFAVGAAAAKFAFDYFGALKQIQMAAPFEAEIAQLQSQLQIREKQIELSKIDGQFRVDRARELATAEENIFNARWEATNATRRAALEFNAQIKQAALSFRIASKTALFGDKIGSVRYAAAQMELAGIGADRVAEAMSNAGNVLGQMPTSEIASDMAVLAARTGASTESIASLSRMFMQLDGASMDVALNMQEGMRAMADSMNIPLDSFMNDMAEASKEMLSYQIKSGSALAKQVGFAKSLGVSFSSVAKAGQSMVLNYRDSIKSEMQLSALLGKQINLSEVRAKFATGDTEGALKAIRAQGLDPSKMDMFQQQALSQALGGMDLQTLMNIATTEGKEAPKLQERRIGESNVSYLARVEAGKKEEAIGSANISAQQAVFSAELEKQITKEYFDKIINPQSEADRIFRDQKLRIETEKANAEIKAIQQNAATEVAKILDPVSQSLKAQITKTNTELELFKNAISGLVMALGGFALQSLGGKAFGSLKKIPNLFKNIFGTRPTIQPPVGPNLPPTPPFPRGPIPDSQLPSGIRRNRAGRLIDTQNRSRYISENAVRQRINIPPSPPNPPTPPTPPPGPSGTSLFGKLKGLVDPKILTKGAKIGGSALSGVFGGVSGFMEAKEKGLGTGEAVGAGLLQGGLAAGGTALGAVFGGPLGMMVGGFLGDTIGGWINKNAPGISESIGNVWDNLTIGVESLKETFSPVINTVKSKFEPLKETFSPVIDTVAVKFESLKETLSPVVDSVVGKFESIKTGISNVIDTISNKIELIKQSFVSIIGGIDDFAKKLGFDEGIAGVFSTIFNLLKSAATGAVNAFVGSFGLLFDLISSIVKLIKGDFSGAWNTLKNGFVDFFTNILSPFEGVWYQIKKSFASFYNMIADSWLGKKLGISKMKIPINPSESKNTFTDREKNILKAVQGNFGKTGITDLTQYQKKYNISNEEVQKIIEKQKLIESQILSKSAITKTTIKTNEQVVQPAAYVKPAAPTKSNIQPKQTASTQKAKIEVKADPLGQIVQPAAYVKPAAPTKSNIQPKQTASTISSIANTQFEYQTNKTSPKVEIKADPNRLIETSAKPNIEVKAGKNASTFNSSEINSISLPIEDLKKISQLQTTELKTINGQLLKTFVRTQTSADNLLHLNNVTMANLIQQNNNMLKFQEATVEILETIAKNTGAGKVPTIKLDGKVLTDQIYTVNQSNRVTGTNKR